MLMTIVAIFIHSFDCAVVLLCLQIMNVSWFQISLATEILISMELQDFIKIK